MTDPIEKKLELISKLLYMQTKSSIVSLEHSLVSTDKQKRLYSCLDGEQNMQELAKSADVSQRMIEDTLPEWEKKGLILGFGKGKSKRYLNLDSLSV